MMPCSLVEIEQYFEGKSPCLHFRRGTTDDGGRRFVSKVGKFLPVYTASIQRTSMFILHNSERMHDGIASSTVSGNCLW